VDGIRSWGAVALSIAFVCACEPSERQVGGPTELAVQAKVELEATAAATQEAPPATQGVPAMAPANVDPLPVFVVARLAHDSPVTDLAWSADGAVIATTSSDGELRLWDARSFALTRTIEGPPRADRFVVSISQDGATVVTNAAHEVRVYDGNTGSSRDVLAHEGPVLAVGVSPDAATIASGGIDGLRIWDADGTERRHVEQRGHEVLSLQLSADGRTLASGWGDQRVRLIDTATGKVTRTLDPGELPVRVVYAGDGARVAAPTGIAQLGIFTTKKGKISATIPLAHPLAFGAGGNLMLAAGPLEGSEFAVTLIDVGSGGIVRGFLGHTGEVTDAMFAPDASQFASASRDTSVLIWVAP
jgi:WD40 repeat protein